jgi:hypothetical protein
MKVSYKPGDRFSAEVEKRGSKGRLKMVKLNFTVLKSPSSYKLIAVTDELKEDNKDVVFRTYNPWELNQLQVL